MDLMDAIDRRVADRHLLKHPFYKAWTAGTLPRAALQDYARQYYAFETKLPRFLTALHARSESSAARKALLANAWDEEHGEANHAELWLRFAEALGVPREEVREAAPTAATQALLHTYWQAASEAPVSAGVAALYAYEAQLPAVAEAKIAGLAEHYGIHGGNGVAFFEVHRAIDVTHAAEERRILEQADGPACAAAVTAADRALDAWWGFLGSFV